MNYAKELAELALKIGAIKLSVDKPFTWASGYHMPIYNDNRLLLSQPNARKLVAEAFRHLLTRDEIEFDLVAGTATAGIPHATTLADLLGCPLIYVRDKPKDHGMKNQIEGIAEEKGLEGKRVVVIEDLISTGGSSVKAVQAVRQAGGKCNRCLGIFSYGFKEGRQAFESLEPPCQLLVILTYTQLLHIAGENGSLKKEEIEILKDWSLDPFAWGEKHGFPKVSK